MLTSGGSHPKAVETRRAWLYAGRTSAATNLQRPHGEAAPSPMTGRAPVGPPLLADAVQAKRPGEQTVVSYRVSTRRVGQWPIHR